MTENEQKTQNEINSENLTTKSEKGGYKTDNASSQTSSDDTFVAILAALPMVGLLIYLLIPDSTAYVRNYSSQSTALTILGFAVGSVGSILASIPIVGLLFAVVNSVIGLVFLGAVLLLLINAAQGKQAYRLPKIGHFAQKYFK